MQASKQKWGGLDFVETDTAIASRESNNTVVLFLILSVLFLPTIEPTVLATPLITNMEYGLLYRGNDTNISKTLCEMIVLSLTTVRPPWVAY